MVDEAETVTDRLDILVGHGRGTLPVRLSDQQDDAGSDADQERERDAQTHERCLSKADGRLRVSGGSGQRSVCPGVIAKPLCFDEAVDYHAVEEKDEDERQNHDQNEGDPRSDVLQEEVIALL